MAERWSEWSMTVDRTRGRVTTERTGSGEVWLNGTVLTPHGIVEVYSQGHGGQSRRSSTYQIVHGGRLYSRSEKVARTKRGLATVAARFAREIVEGAG